MATGKVISVNKGNTSGGTAYKDAGVNVEAGYQSVELMKKYIASTHIPGVIGGIGNFGAIFQTSENECLVSGADGVGTKLRLAFLLDKHDTIGIDAVAMCVNDIICLGAQPLFFLDYLAMAVNVPDKTAEIVKGICEGCVMSGCALIGGETAEMPGFYKEGEYDVAGFAIGRVDKSKLLNAKELVRPGDVLIGLASSGVHSNGFSLVRKLFDIDSGNCSESNLIELITPTKIYVKSVLSVLSKYGLDIHGISNITGGGFIENIPRILPDDLRAEVHCGIWPTLDIFDKIQAIGNISDEDMYNTFNMGIGMIMAVSKSKVNEILGYLNSIGESAYLIGSIKQGDAGIDIVL